VEGAKPVNRTAAANKFTASPCCRTRLPTPVTRHRRIAVEGAIVSSALVT
jgi:hypothetical protein